MVACTMVFEGDEDWCKLCHKNVVEMGKKYNGIVGGPENGMRGYLLTFLIAYSRDFAMDYKCLAESFETSIAWSKVSELCKRIRSRVFNEAMALGFKESNIWISFRVTQVYETGAAVYVYLSLTYKGLDESKAIENYEIVEDAARDEVMNVGGCISHHHGVGKIRKKFIGRTVPDLAIEWQDKVKKIIDPQNIFAINNTIPRSDGEKAEIQAQLQSIIDNTAKANGQ